MSNPFGDSESFSYYSQTLPFSVGEPNNTDHLLVLMTDEQERSSVRLGAGKLFTNTRLTLKILGRLKAYIKNNFSVKNRREKMLFVT